MGYEFEICAPDVDEHVTGHARDIVYTLAQRKAHAAATHFSRGVIVASDTLVSLDGAPLGKPEDAADARRMLTALSDREHEVFTGVCVLDAKTGRMETRSVRTGVTFRALAPGEIEAYIATGEPMDKAGAYGAQGRGALFVERIEGDFFNVMGLPLCRLGKMLKEQGVSIL
jgi:septum formation protein